MSALAGGAQCRLAQRSVPHIVSGAAVCCSAGPFYSCQGAPRQGPYAPQGSASLLPKLSVTSKVSAPTLCAWVGSRVRFRSSEDVTLSECTSPVDREYMRRCQKFR